MKSHNVLWNYNYISFKRAVELFIVLYESPFCQNLEGKDLYDTWQIFRNKSP